MGDVVGHVFAFRGWREGGGNVISWCELVQVVHDRYGGVVYLSLQRVEEIMSLCGKPGDGGFGRIVFTVKQSMEILAQVLYLPGMKNIEGQFN